MRPFRSIAIDGPSGAGKSTLAKALAARLGFLYVDTGAIYRTVGLYVARQGGDCGDPQQVLPRLPELQLSLTYGADGLQHMLLAGEEYGAEWCCAGAISRKGHPHHPLYLRKDEKLRPFDVKAYLEQL